MESGMRVSSLSVSLVLSHGPHEGGDLDDLDGVEVLEIQEMEVLREDIIGVTFQGDNQERVSGFHFFLTQRGTEKS